MREFFYNNIKFKSFGLPMKKTLLGLLLIIVTLAFASAEAQATVKKRGWSLKGPNATCTMQNVATAKSSGQMEMRQIRICDAGTLTDGSGQTRSLEQLPFN
jgi:hypothetical protein